MSELIALHWGSDEITAVLPKGRALQAAALSRPEAIAGDPAALGRWLKAELSTKRIAGKRAAIVLPRSAAVFRKLHLPEMPDDELPDAVRMQAATKSPTPLDRLRLDFVPLPRRGEGREVLLATVASKTIDDLLAAVRAAGLEPTAVGLSPIAAAAKVADQTPALIVAIQGQFVEITLVRDGAVLFSHATDLPDETADENVSWLSSEISRAVVAADHLATSGGISRIVLLGPAEFLAPLAAPLSERYGAPAELIESPEKLGVADAAGDVSVAAVAAAAGQLQTGGPARLDFLSPRKRIEKPDRRRLQAGLAVGGIAAALLIAYGMTLLRQSDLQSEIDQLTGQTAGLEKTLKQGQPTLDARRAIDTWRTAQAESVDQLALLRDALPGTDRAYLTELTFEPGGRDSMGRISGKGAARTRYDVETLNDALSAKGYRITPTSTLTSNRDPDYPVRFEMILTIPKPAAAATTRTPRPGARS